MAAELLAGPNARHLILNLEYEGKDITRDVWDFVESFRYVDRTLRDKMDEISVKFHDVPGLWRSGWFPDQGAKFKATMKTRNWFKPGDDLKRECGSFEIDDLQTYGPPSIFIISAIAVGITASIRRQENTKAWESFTVRAMAEEISSNHGFELKWYSNYNPTIDRFDQRSESDLAFLQRVCEYAGLMLKITSDAIVVFRGEEFDAEDPVFNFKRSFDGLVSWSFNANSADVYSACEVQYYDAGRKELVKYLYSPEGISGTIGGHRSSSGGTSSGGGLGTYNPNTGYVDAPASGTKHKSREQEIKEPNIGQVLKVNRRCMSMAEAQEVAKAALRNTNMRQIKGTLSFMGHPILYSGANCTVEGFGRFDTATWQIEEVTHDYSVWGGYKTDVSLRGILGY